MTQSVLQICKNCGDVIGRLEPASHWNGHAVCSLCFAKLNRASTITPVSLTPAVAPPLATAAPSPPPLPPLQFPDGIDLQLLQNFTGQTEVRSVGHALAILRAATKNHSSAKSAVFDSRVKTGVQRLRYAEARYGITPVVDAFLLASVPTLFVAILLIFSISPSLAVLAVILVAIHGSGLILLLGLFHDRAGEAEGNRRELRAREYNRQVVLLTDRCKALVAAKSDLDRASRLHYAVTKAANSTFNLLLRTNVNALDGPTFERFLASVFRVHGYVVQPIGRTGDQGADLIVELPGKRLAVQAKCWSGSVGNSAVQEAHAGKGFYHCDLCMVVTNSYFTASAKTLARELGCQLIDGHSLPHLIRGSIRIGLR